VAIAGSAQGTFQAPPTRLLRNAVHGAASR
jgi:hypothetical protein